MLALDAGKAVAAGADQLVLEIDVDVVPVGEGLVDFLRRGAVRLGEVFKRLVGEHHAPAERVVRPVALIDRDLVRPVLQFHED